MPAEDPSGWSVRELRAFLDAHHVDASACVEKSDLVQLARQTLAERGSGGSQQQPQRSPPQPDPMEDRPGTSFYKQRLARAAALSDDERGSDAAAFLATDQLLSEMAEMLPLAQRTNGQWMADPSVSRDTVTLTLLKDVVASDMAHGYILHPTFSYMRLPYYLDPYMTNAINPATGRASNATTMQMMLTCLPSSQPVTDLHLLARLLSCADMMAGNPSYLRVTRDKISALQACLRSLRNPAAQSSLEAQLEALRQRAGWNLSEMPTLHGLQGRYCWLVVSTCHNAFTRLNADDMELPADLMDLWRSEATQLARLRPYQPRAHYQLANLAMAMPGARFLGKTAIQHLLRGLELARALKDGYWIARCASAAARNAAATGCPDVPPQQARALMAEASAAEAGCRKVLPEAWVKVLDVPEATREAKRCIDKHMARGSPRAWIPRIVNAHEGALMPAPGTRGSVCAGCGKEGIGLRSCSACHSPQDRYCSRECQAKHWPLHKAECKAAQATQAAKKKGASQRR